MKILSNSPGVLWDCHMHSEFSADSGTPTADMIRQAIALGFKGICFTEHLDPDYPPTPDDLEFALDIPAYYTQRHSLTQREPPFRCKADAGMARISPRSIRLKA